MRNQNCVGVGRIPDSISGIYISGAASPSIIRGDVAGTSPIIVPCPVLAMASSAGKRRASYNPRGPPAPPPQPCYRCQQPLRSVPLHANGRDARDTHVFACEHCGVAAFFGVPVDPRHREWRDEFLTAIASDLRDGAALPALISEELSAPGFVKVPRPPVSLGPSSGVAGA